MSVIECMGRGISFRSAHFSDMMMGRWATDSLNHFSTMSGCKNGHTVKRAWHSMQHHTGESPGMIWSSPRCNRLSLASATSAGEGKPNTTGTSAGCRPTISMIRSWNSAMVSATSASSLQRGQHPKCSQSLERMTRRR